MHRWKGRGILQEPKQAPSVYSLTPNASSPLGIKTLGCANSKVSSVGWDLAPPLPTCQMPSFPVSQHAAASLLPANPEHGSSPLHLSPSCQQTEAPTRSPVPRSEQVPRFSSEFESVCLRLQMLPMTFRGTVSLEMATSDLGACLTVDQILLPASTGKRVPRQSQSHRPPSGFSFGSQRSAATARDPFDVIM